MAKNKFFALLEQSIQKIKKYLLDKLFIND
jgi:hypothetical protein